MMRINYVGLVWLLAQLLHPLIWMVYEDFVWSDLEVMLGLMVFTAVISLPVLFIGILTFSKIMYLNLSVISKFIIFLLVIESGILITDFFFSLFFFEFDMFTDMLLFSSPAAIAVVLAFVITLPVFLKHAQSYEDNEY